MTTWFSRNARSLTGRLVSTFLGVSMTIVLLVAIVAYRQARTALREQVLERLLAIADSREQQLDRWIDGQRVEVRFLAGLPRLRDQLPDLLGERGVVHQDSTRKGLTTYFRRTQSQKGEFSEVFVLSVPGGQVVASTDSTRLGDYRVTDTYYVEGQKGSFVQNVYPSAARPEGTPTLTISTPLPDSHGRVRAVLAAHLNLQEIDSIFTDRGGLGATGESYLTDRFHVFVSSTRFGRPAYPRGVRTVAVNRAADQHESGTATYLDYTGVPVLGVYRWLPKRDLALIVEMDTEEAFAPASRLLSTMIIVGVLSILVLTVLVIAAARRIARPVVAIAGAADQVAAGDFSAVAPVETRDEVGRLAVAFNKMTQRLSRHYDDQQEHAHALEHSKRLLQEIIDSSNSFISVTDLEERIILANRPFTELIGREPAEIIGRPLLEIVPTVNSEQRAAVMAQAMATTRPVEMEETLDLGGVLRTVLLSRVMLRGVDGAPYACCSIATDITRIKQGEEERRLFAEQLQHTQKLESLGVLAGGIAHDFNNLLTSILGHANLVLDELPEGSPSGGDVTRIVQAAQRAAEMTNQMLAYAGRGKFVLAQVNLNALVTEMSQLLQISISKKVELSYEMAPGLPGIEGDPSQLQQVVMNLITNAAEAIGDRPGTITLRTESIHVAAGQEPASVGHEPLPEGEYVGLIVADTGSGMDPATVARIFEPFFTTKFTGRGLGLAAVQGIIRSHRGSLTVDSTPGRGTTFTVLFPAVKASPPVARPSPAEGAARSSSGTVLIVDDEDSIRSFARRALERAGYKVLAASDGVAAVDLFRENPGTIGVVVLDLTMPVMDGRQVLGHLRALDPGVRVVLSSGFSEQELSVRGEAAGEPFLQKPYELSELLEKVRGMMPQ
ncbi:MAG TPA: ATP-binding protein [Gemmatimonadales bacterium]|nr:ATP-binding protein [Gemmatimonadales bacterium]